MRISPGKDLREYVDIVEIVIDNTMYAEEKEVVVFSPKVGFSEVYMRDYQTAVSNGTEHEVKVTFRYDDRLTNKMRIKREDGREYKIKQILHDELRKRTMTVVAERVDD